METDEEGSDTARPGEDAVDVVLRKQRHAAPSTK
jgi:hypothetical protein